MTTPTSITSGQLKQYKRFVEDAAERALKEVNLDKNGIQKLIEQGDEFQARIIAGIRELSRELSVSNQFADEVVQSSYTYPKEYAGPKPIADQIKAIAKIFGLDPKQALEYAKNLPELPNGAEGWFAIPTVDALGAKHFPEVTDPADKYCRAVQLVHAKIAKSRKFYNWREGEITPNRLRVHARTAHALDLIAENQPGDILIVAGQLGMRHRGESVRRARETFVSNEFGLGSLAVGSIVLVHPERFVRWKELDMDCSGDELAPGAVGDFSYAPYFIFFDGKVGFGASWIGNPLDRYGSVSGFVPQS